MLREVLTVSALIVVLLLVRAAFKNRVPKRMIYCLWLVVLLKLCLPVTLFSLPLLPAEEVTLPAQTVQTTPVVSTASTVPAPSTTAVQPAMPTQTASQPEMKTQRQPATPAVHQPAKPAAKPITTVQILRIVWFGGSALLGLWLFASWLTFTIRLHKSRKFLGKRGRTNIYVSRRIKSPCLAGLIPAVYLTEDVLRNDTTELILRHELTHLHHLDFLWSFCRTAAVIVYWWNPLVWLAAIFSKRDAELACDEAVAAGLQPEQRIAYARAILAQAPRKKAALSLAGPPVKERILFLTKKQKTSVLCVVLALALTVSATGCSFAEFTKKAPEEPAVTGEGVQPQQETESTSFEEQILVDETARGEWFDFAHKYRLDSLPVFEQGKAPASASAYLDWIFRCDMENLKKQGYMSKEYVETKIKAYFGVETVIHETMKNSWSYDAERYTSVPLGLPDEDVARLDSVVTMNVGGHQLYYVQYCRMWYDKPLGTDEEWNRYRDEIVSGETPDLLESREYTLGFYIQDGEPVFLSHTELSIDEPPFTPLPNDGTYDVTQPLQEWELTRTNGVQTGMTQAQVETITGPLTPDESGTSCLDSQNVSYRFQQMGYRTPQLAELRWNGTVKNDEIVCETAQDVPAFRGICLGDTIDEVFDKFPCTDRELKQWAVQYVYGFDGASDSAALSFIADSFYALTFTINGQRRAMISFSRVQQRAYLIEVYADMYWQTEMTANSQEQNTLPTPTASMFGLTEDGAALFDAAISSKYPRDDNTIILPRFSEYGGEYGDTQIVFIGEVHYDYYYNYTGLGCEMETGSTSAPLRATMEKQGNKWVCTDYNEFTGGDLSSWVQENGGHVAEQDASGAWVFPEFENQHWFPTEEHMLWRYLAQVETPPETSGMTQTEFETHMQALASGKSTEDLTLDAYPDVLAQDETLNRFVRGLPEDAALCCSNYLIKHLWFGFPESDNYAPNGDLPLTALGRLYVLTMQYLMITHNRTDGELRINSSETDTPDSWYRTLWSCVPMQFAEEHFSLDSSYYSIHPIEKQYMTALLRTPKRLLGSTKMYPISEENFYQMEESLRVFYDYLANGTGAEHMTTWPLYPDGATPTREDLLAACTENVRWEIYSESNGGIMLSIGPDTKDELQLVYDPDKN